MFFRVLICSRVFHFNNYIITETISEKSAAFFVDPAATLWYLIV